MHLKPLVSKPLRRRNFCFSFEQISPFPFLSISQQVFSFSMQKDIRTCKGRSEHHVSILSPGPFLEAM